MDRGELPRVNPQRIWVQAGTWERCALCGSAITDSETEYELQFTLRLISFSFHAACYATWLAECTRAIAQQFAAAVVPAVRLACRPE